VICYWDRKITAVKEINYDRCTYYHRVDAKYKGRIVAKYAWDGRIQQTGVENLKFNLHTIKQSIKDEYHRWNAISIENVQDAWVRQVVFEHFAGSAVNILETAKSITIEDCKSLTPISEIAGERRNTFLTTGQQTLISKNLCRIWDARFCSWFLCSLGLMLLYNASRICHFSFSGTIDSWASGVLFDIVNVDGQALSYLNRGQDGQGAGWTAANSVFWQCSAARVDNYQPPTAQNWAFGTWAQFAGNGYWDMSNEQIQPRSLILCTVKR
jgi:hypothetical protein